MIRPIIHDPLFLGQQSKPATEADRQIITDLMDTLRANLDRCVGMAANMIGEKKRIIVFCNGPMQMVMVNPQITAKSGEYETEEGRIRHFIPAWARLRASQRRSSSMRSITATGF